MFLLSYRNTSGSLGEQELLCQHELQASVSTAFLTSPKLSRPFLQLDRNTENMFSISFRKHCNEKNGKQLVNFDYQNVNALCSCHQHINSLCSMFLSSYRNTNFNQPVYVFSKVCFLNPLNTKLNHRRKKRDKIIYCKNNLLRSDIQKHHDLCLHLRRN